MAYQKLALIAGNCLFPDHSELNPDSETLFFMAEDDSLCTHYRYHKQKLVLFLSAMRSHADNLRKKYALHYQTLTEENRAKSYEDKLDDCLVKNQQIRKLVTYDLEDHFFRDRIRAFCANRGLELEVVDSPGFLTSQRELKEWLSNNKPLMQRFYQWQRKRLQMLLTDEGKPLHQKWSFDAENRQPLPATIVLPEEPKSELTQHDRQVIDLVNKLFPNHPGSTDNFNWSTTRRGALHRLNYFLHDKFENFGPYEDAIHRHDSFLFHSVLSPYLNLGLITPAEVLEKALAHYRENQTHFPSVEGFIRQVAGWREFIRGIYHHYDLEKNYFNHERRLKDCWYDGSTGLIPLDDSIRKTLATGYSHHIERLMIIGNCMLLTEIDPREVFRWFMEMYVDSSDWVMAPNVYDMSQFATGGLFATKPYIAGSNYILKMSNYQKGAWCDIMDGLYWRFIDRHRATFAANYRMRMMLGTLDKMTTQRKEYLFEKARAWVAQVSE